MARPTEPWCSSHSSLVMAQTVDRALGAGVGDELHRRHVVAGLDLVGQRQHAHEVGGHHDRGLTAVGVDGGEGALGVELGEDDRRYARGQQAHARQGAGVIHGSDDEVGAERGETALLQRLEVFDHGGAAGEHRRR